MGYVGFGRLRLRDRRADRRRPRRAVARWTRPWTLAAWLFLTCGIALGSWWAYYELGWGGWWFWDPVENASSCPWLVGTALIHSLAVTEKRGAFKSWTVLLAILAFSLSLLGTFLVRSGVLSSVHAFATDLAARTVHPGLPRHRRRHVAHALCLARAESRPGRGSRCCRARRCSGNNVMLVGPWPPCCWVRCTRAGPGRAWPGQDLGRPPYFELVFMPLMAPVVFPMGRPAGTLEAGRAARARRAPALAAAMAVAAALLGGWLAGRTAPVATIGLVMGQWIVATVATDLWSRVRSREGAGIGARLALLPRLVVGMMVAHSASRCSSSASRWSRPTRSSATSRCRAETARPSKAVPSAARPARGRGAEPPRHPGLGEVTRDGNKVTTLLPEKRVYRADQPDDRGRDPDRPHARPLRRSASRSRAARGSCAFTTSPSSTGSGRRC